MIKDSKVIFRIPAELHEDFKVASSVVGLGMSDILRQMVAQFCIAQGIIPSEQQQENENGENIKPSSVAD